MNEIFELKTDEFRKKADRILSVIKNINRQGGITSKLMMAAACIEVHSFEMYLLNISIMHREKGIGITSIKMSEIEKYIRLFNDAYHDLFSSMSYNNEEQEQNDADTIFDLVEEICCNKRLSELVDHCEDLDSWKELRTDHDMLRTLLHTVIDGTVIALEDIYQIIRDPKYSANQATQMKRRPRNDFREFIKDKEMTDEILEKIHRLMGNKINTAAADILKEAMWIDWIDRPTIPSVKAEFKNIKCSHTPISNKIKEGERKPMKLGKVDKELLKNIKDKFEQA